MNNLALYQQRKTVLSGGEVTWHRTSIVYTSHSVGIAVRDEDTNKESKTPVNKPPYGESIHCMCMH